MTALVLCLILAAILWFWQDSLRARERAREASIQLCRSKGVQLLDDTVALQNIWMQRGDSGWPEIGRTYVFEFTENGQSRIRGGIVILGKRTVVLNSPGDDLVA